MSNHAPVCNSCGCQPQKKTFPKKKLFFLGKKGKVYCHLHFFFWKGVVPCLLFFGCLSEVTPCPWPCATRTLSFTHTHKPTHTNTITVHSKRPWSALHASVCLSPHSVLQVYCTVWVGGWVGGWVRAWVGGWVRACVLACNPNLEP